MATPAFTMLRETIEARRRGIDGDVLHFVADTGPLYKSRRPSVVTVHGVASRWVDNIRKPWLDEVWRYRVRQAIRSTDRVITVSNSSAQDIQDVFGIDRSSISVIPHGIETEKFRTPVEVSDSIASVLPKEFVLYLGNIEPRKNLRELIEAFRTPDIRDLGVPLVIAGKPAWDFQEIMQAIDATPNVIHLGFVSDTDRTALMQRCQLFVFPSLYEGFGFPVLEALSAGAVVLASRRGSLQEVAGPSLALHDLGAAGIAEGLVSALTSPEARESCRRLGPQWAMNFSWDRSVDSHIALYRSVAS
jgi:glycosyltransferase involved in cell wall biosynthesis